MEPLATLEWELPQQLICDHLEAITRGTFLKLGARNRLLINVPPGSMKSLIVSVMWAAYEWGPMGMPSLRHLATSYGPGPVDRDNLKFVTLIKSEWYQKHWPTKFVRQATDEMVNTDTGSRMSAPFMSITSLRGDRFNLDDPHSSAESDDVRNKATRQFREGALNRLNNQEVSAIVVIMQRLHANDMSGVILRDLKGYIHLNLPLEYEPDRACYTPLPVKGQEPVQARYDVEKQSWYVEGAEVPPERVEEVEKQPWQTVYKQDPRTHAGELLAPKRFPQEAVELIKVEMGSYAYAGQYQERPSPREGAMFKRAWFADKFLKGVPHGIRWVRHWDLAGTKEEGRGDRTGTVKMGKAPDGRFIIANARAFKEEGAEVRKIVKTTAYMDTRQCIVSMNQDPGQAGKEQAKSYITTTLPGFTVRMQLETGEKSTRAEPFSVQCEAGNVYLVEGDWNETYLEELCTFPGGRYDDLVDASSGAFNRLTSRGGVIATAYVMTSAHLIHGDHPGNS